MLCIAQHRVVVRTMPRGLVEYILYCFIASSLHEIAHALVATALGSRIKRVGISWRGPYLVREQGIPILNLCVVVSGPALNLILAFAYWYSAREFALINLVLGASNALPFLPGGDGRNAMAAIRKLRASG